MQASKHLLLILLNHEKAEINFLIAALKDIASYGVASSERCLTCVSRLREYQSSGKDIHISFNVELSALMRGWCQNSNPEFETLENYESLREEFFRTFTW